MDIAKYIGLFLLKNSFCYLHGLGNLVLKKKAASFDGELIKGPEYDVVLTPGGSIDDTLANFIATHEQTSISKAANALRDFSTSTRAELAQGKEVELPGIGHFYEQQGVVKFRTNAQLQYTPAAAPVLKISKRVEEAPSFQRELQEESANRSASSSIAWNKILLLVLLVAVVIAVAFFGFRYYQSKPDAPKADTLVTIPNPVTLPAPAILPDTVAKVDSPLAAPAPQTSASTGFTVILNRYPTKAAAERRAGFLSKNGNVVEVLSKDSATHYVVMKMNTPAADTTRMLDSLRRFFNPKGVSILH
ncbi:MAG: hypothetical protein JST36_02835 [Bacteroidetes bacterium]|nr:hypothetical protein [Bacteroidota bacterium]